RRFGDRSERRGIAGDLVRTYAAAGVAGAAEQGVRLGIAVRALDGHLLAVVEGAKALAVDRRRQVPEIGVGVEDTHEIRARLRIAGVEVLGMLTHHLVDGGLE